MFPLNVLLGRHHIATKGNSPGCGLGRCILVHLRQGTLPPEYSGTDPRKHIRVVLQYLAHLGVRVVYRASGP